jgi:uncharacterized protein VcgC/VcgE DUF2780
MRVTKSVVIMCLVSLVTMGAQAQAPAAAAPNNELVGLLANQLRISPQQAQGGAGAIFGLVKTKVNPAQFNKISSVVPGMDGLLSAAPAPGTAAQGSAQGETTQAAQGAAQPNTPQGAAGGLQGATGALQGGAAQGVSSATGSLGSMAPGGAGGLASLAGSFQSLGMSPTMVSKFAPIMQNYLGTKGGPGVASIFGGALK